MNILEKISIYSLARLIQFTANLMKGLCYLFHFLFPNIRFTIPRHSSPLIKSSNKNKIPNILWQTNFTDKVTLAVYINYLVNRLFAPQYEYRFMTTEDRSDFIKANYSNDIFQAYSKLQIGASQADFWRILILQKHGGIYLDIDAHFVCPLNVLIKKHYSELYLIRKQGNFSNHFIASIKKHSNLEKIINLILKNIHENKIKCIYSLTGPEVFNKVLNLHNVNSEKYLFICSQGNFTNEYFQYIDKKEGKWTKAQKKIKIVN